MNSEKNIQIARAADSTRVKGHIVVLGGGIVPAIHVLCGGESKAGIPAASKWRLP
jgi:hypothetical protein